MAWRGIGADSDVWWSTFDGSSWSGEELLADRRKDSSREVGEAGGQIMMAWRGIGTDSHVWWSTFDGSTWSGQQPLADRRTDSSPALGAASGQLMLAWRGIGPGPQAVRAPLGGRPVADGHLPDGRLTALCPR